MPTVKEVFGEVLGKLRIRELTVSAAREVAPRFRRIDLSGTTLRGASFEPGNKLQIMLRGGTRTYSPFAFDAERGALSLLVYVHGSSPGAAWAERVSEGERVRVFGPRASLALRSLRAPVVLFGDESSFGVARALAEASATPSACVFEVSRPADSALALEHLALAQDGLVSRRDDDAHLSEVAERLRGLLARDPAASLVLTGRAAAIQRLRAALKGPSTGREQKTKAYWALGKRGLD